MTVAPANTGRQGICVFFGLGLRSRGAPHPEQYTEESGFMVWHLRQIIEYPLAHCLEAHDLKSFYTKDPASSILS
jgi:hypothetical protein